MPPPLIAIFLPSLVGGGAERMMLNLARGLVEAGVPVDLVVGTLAGPYRDLVPAACTLVDLHAGRVLAALPGLIRYLRARRPRTLLAAMDHANMVALWARSVARVPTRVYVGVRSTLSLDAANSPYLGGRWMPRLAAVFYPRAAAVIAVSQGVAADLERLIGAGRARVLVLPNPVVTPELDAQAAAPVDHPWLQPGGPPVILAAGRLSPEKDYPTLIRAFATLAGAGDQRLVILGEGPQRAPLEALIRDLGLAARVALPGFRANPFAYMARARLFVLASRWEGLPGVLIQAMACGTPVVSTDCPSGPREILADGRYGPLVPVGAVADLAAAMARTLAHPPEPAHLKAGAAPYRLAPVTRRYLEVLGLAADAGATP